MRLCGTRDHQQRISFCHSVLFFILFLSYTRRLLLSFFPLYLLLRAFRFFLHSQFSSFIANYRQHSKVDWIETSWRWALLVIVSRSTKAISTFCRVIYETRMCICLSVRPCRVNTFSYTVYIYFGGPAAGRALCFLLTGPARLLNALRRYCLVA